MHFNFLLTEVYLALIVLIFIITKQWNIEQFSFTSPPNGYLLFSPHLHIYSPSSPILLHQSDLLVWFSLEADVLLLKPVLIQYITIPPAAYSTLEITQMRPLQSNLAISIMSDYVIEQDPILHITSVLINDHLLLIG